MTVVVDTTQSSSDSAWPATGSSRDEARSAMSETNHNAPKKRTLFLKRETVGNLDSGLLSSQGHSLWTCDGTEAVDRPAPDGPHRHRLDR